MSSIWKGIAGTVRRAVTRGTRPAAPRPPAPRPPVPRAPGRQPTSATAGRSLTYQPNLDGDADPGEVVWTWVPYEEDPAQGKDRPVLVVGRSGADVLALMLSSQADRDGRRHWFPLGEGAWDRESRPSWIRLDRVLTVDADAIRREGAVLERGRFEAVAAELREHYGWR